jgi:hypothetical protein
MRGWEVDRTENSCPITGYNFDSDKHSGCATKLLV